MLPRDNKMYFVSEGYNIDPAPEPSIVQKLAQMDIDIRKLRIKNYSTTDSYYSQSTANSFRDIGVSQQKKDTAKSRQAIDEYDRSKSHATSKLSIKSKKSEMSLEEKLLKGFYKIPE